MNTYRTFYWKKVKDAEYDIDYIALGFSGTLSESIPVESDAMECLIAPLFGSNLCRFTVGGHNVIDFKPKVLLEKGYTGMPVLYPTPNRVRNGVFVYEGKIYTQVKRGEPVFEHGLVHSEPWSFKEPEVKSDSVTLTTSIDFDSESELFESFPFKHRLQMNFCLQADGIKITYCIENKDNKEIPFGFGLHPYFMKLSGEKKTYIKLPAKYLMDYTSDLLPTGRLIETKGTIYDITNPVSIGNFDLDHVFTCIDRNKYAEVEYRTLGLKITLETTPDFTHMVVYSPRGNDFFCIENQTCSTDAHNLFDRGFEQESGLKMVPAGEKHTGTVKYKVSKEAIK
jgi:aldose 1-epimerase